MGGNNRKGSQSNKTPATDVNCPTDANCPTCKSTADGDALLCDLCQLWFHAECVDIDDKSFHLLKKLDQLWFCPTCKPAGKKFFQLDAKLNNLEKRFDTFEKTVISNFELVLNLLHNQTALSENQTVPYSNASQLDVNKIVVDAVRDAMEAESKKYVAVLENFDTPNDDKLLEDVKTFVRKAGFDPALVQQVRRSGPVIQSRNTGRDLPRIVKVKCDSEATRNDLLKSVIRYCDKGKVSKVFARPDRTWQQREKLRRLHIELDAKRAAGEENWFIDRNVYVLKRGTRKLIPRA